MEVLFSKTGSQGNSSVISDGKTILVIDVGIKYEKVNAGCRYKLSQASGAIISHAHMDHISHVRDFQRFGVKIFASDKTLNTAQISGSKRSMQVVKSGEQFRIGTFLIKPFDVAHTNTDGTDCENYGYLIYSLHTKEKAVWITDASFIESRFPPLDYIFIECNYVDVEDYSDELDCINTFVEKRRVRSHLSLGRCVDFLKKQDLSNIKYIKLLHLTNNQGNIYNIILDRMQKEFPGIKFVI